MGQSRLNKYVPLFCPNCLPFSSTEVDCNTSILTCGPPTFLPLFKKFTSWCLWPLKLRGNNREEETDEETAPGVKEDPLEIGATNFS